ncbi:MAG TPA: NAD-dependent epimerase/dehydratase family protein [Longimicrobiales bacterium]|nr:NAD-dependent epimerase/dehydratase family protein [Longimicrobiales bacterium]
MSERIVVSGGAGFIGSRLVRRLLDAGHDVAALDSLVPAVHGEDAAPPAAIAGARFLKGDVRDGEAWKAVLADATRVYHLAAETGTGESMYRSRHYVDVNVGGTALLCDLLLSGAAPRVTKVVLASSRAVYGEGPYRCREHGVVVPAPRTSARLAEGLWEPLCPRCGAEVALEPASPAVPAAPTSVYGVTKRDQEELCHLLLPPKGMGVVSLRLQNVYGPGQSLRNPYTGILSIFSVRLLAGQGVRVFEDGLASRDFVYVDDVVDAFVRAGNVEPPPGGAVVDVGSGVATPVLEAAVALAERYGAPRSAVEVTGEFRVGDIRHAVADPRAARELLGLGASTPFARGLDALADWVRTSERPASGLEGALAEMARSGLLGRAHPPAPGLGMP